jgi:uncharacterized protein (DUF2236 family)
VAFYAETRPIGRAFGVPERRLPADLDRFEEYVELMLGPGGPVRVSPVARELATAVLRPPLAPLAGWLPGGEAIRPLLGRIPVDLYAWTLWPAVGLLPATVRIDYASPWGARERLVSDWLVAAWRAWRPRQPRSGRCSRRSPPTGGSEDHAPNDPAASRGSARAALHRRSAAR